MKFHDLLAGLLFAICLVSCSSAQTENNRFQAVPRNLPVQENNPVFRNPGNSAQDTPPAASSSTDQLTIRCGVHLIDDIDLPAREPGALASVDVKEGAVVTKGQLLGFIDDTIARHQKNEATFRHQVATSIANDSSKVESAQRMVSYSTEEYNKIRKLYAKGSASESEFNEKRTRMEIDRLSYENAQNEKSRAAIDADAELVKVKAAEDSIERHQLVSPVDGVVFKVYKNASEWVAAGESVFRIVRMDQLKIKGFVNAASYNPSQIANRRVTVTGRMAQGEVVQFNGRVVFVAMEHNGSDEEFEFHAEVENKRQGDYWMLLAGSLVDATIHLDEIAVEKATPRVLPASNQPGSAVASGK